ncbi:DUF6098 family protein [Georgenia muralis]|uniref:Uncharacterized protein n=1 Tax=Georgenia muralis TaxID=154117 RepID=A0A3N4ZT88_9MICO|nr:DUF6098 family protein [Georgenia muralis]RPF28708.1 hypothetical protein EDD32_3247 [Georgenia muralis]
MTLGTTTPPVGGTHDGPPRLLLTLADLEAVVRAVGSAHLYVGTAPHLLRAGAWHAESGYPLPGLPAWPLRAEPWWQGGQRVWIARQLVRRAGHVEPSQSAWVVVGAAAGRGGDGEPLLADPRTLAEVGAGVHREAAETYTGWREREFR